MCKTIKILELLQEWGVGLNENGGKVGGSKEEEVDWEARRDWLPVARPQN